MFPPRLFKSQPIPSGLQAPSLDFTSLIFLSFLLAFSSSYPILSWSTEWSKALERAEGGFSSHPQPTTKVYPVDYPLHQASSSHVEWDRSFTLSQEELASRNSFAINPVIRHFNLGYHINNDSKRYTEHIHAIL